MEINKLMKKEVKSSDFLVIISFFILAAGVILGSLYLSKIGADYGDGIKVYLDGFIQSGAERDCFAVFKKALKENLLSLAVVFAAGFFRFGMIFTAASVIRRGFVIGFTASSFIKFYGLKGLLIMSATMPSVLIIVPAFLIFAAVSAKFSVSKEKNQKKFIISYIFFTFFIFTIFCAAALSEGYLTTTFMKWIFPKID